MNTGLDPAKEVTPTEFACESGFCESVVLWWPEDEIVYKNEKYICPECIDEYMEENQ